MSKNRKMSVLLDAKTDGMYDDIVAAAEPFADPFFGFLPSFPKNRLFEVVRPIFQELNRVY